MGDLWVFAEPCLLTPTKSADEHAMSWTYPVGAQLAKGQVGGLDTTWDCAALNRQPDGLHPQGNHGADAARNLCKCGCLLAVPCCQLPASCLLLLQLQQGLLVLLPLLPATYDLSSALMRDHLLLSSTAYH